MAEDDSNSLHGFLREQGIPVEELPTLIEVSPLHLVPITEGYNKKNKDQKFYVCVCNSGHNTCCGETSWTYSGWTMRISGTNVIFFKGDRIFDLTQIPLAPDILFIVSKRVFINEVAAKRCDILHVDSRRKKLQRKPKKPETNRIRRQH
ncbi:MAG: hypothetical protein NTX91_04445 [candidate division SR1 bacterium]|nr:hypothetical protein [candidate division SR1 bacterium]